MGCAELVVLSLADSGGGGGGRRGRAPPLLKFQRGSSNGTAAARPPLSTNPGSAPDYGGNKPRVFY